MTVTRRRKKIGLEKLEEARNKRKEIISDNECLHGKCTICTGKNFCMEEEKIAIKYNII